MDRKIIDFIIIFNNICVINKYLLNYNFYSLIDT